MVHEGWGQGKRPGALGDLNVVDELMHQTCNVHNDYFRSLRLGSEMKGARTERPTKTVFASGFKSRARGRKSVGKGRYHVPATPHPQVLQCAKQSMINIGFSQA